MGLISKLDGFCYPVSNFWLVENRSYGAIWHDEVDLPLCFGDTAVLYVVCTVFWVLTGFKLFLSRKTRHSLPISWLNATKLGLLVLPFMTALCDFFFTIYQGTRPAHLVANFQYLSPLVVAITTVLAAVVIVFDKHLGARSSALQFVFWLAMTLYGSIKLRSLILIAEDESGVKDKFRFVTFCLQYAVYVVEFVLSFIPERISLTRGSYQLQRDDERKPCPEEEAVFFSKLTWWWLNGLIWRGWRRSLDNSDLTDVCTTDYSSVVTPRFEKFWKRELKRAGLLFDHAPFQDGPDHAPLHEQPNDIPLKTFGGDDGEEDGEEDSVLVHQPREESRKRRKPSLLWALFRSFAPAMFQAALFKISHDLLLFVGPQMLRLMIGFAKDPSQPAWKGYFYAVILFVTAVVQSLCLHQYFFICTRVGMNVRSAIMSTVYKKSLCLSNQARQSKTVGEIVNLMSVDAQRLLELMTFIHILWSGPFQIALSIIFLWFSIGPSIFAGLGFLLLLIPLNAFIGSIQKKFQMKQMAEKDKRTKIVNELLNGFKVVKLYAWEKPFKKRVMEKRADELVALRRTASLGIFSTFIWTCAPFMVAFVVFATYGLANRNNPDQTLTAERIFVSLSLINIIRFPMSVFPTVISSLVSASVSLKRLRDFLQSEEMDPHSVEHSEHPPRDSEDAVCIRNGSFFWDTPDKLTLSSVDFHAHSGELVAVVGQVGAGKSSLISALLGEMRKLAGHVTVKGSIAYVPQLAWIMNATLRDNVLFGKTMNSSRYQETLHVCALEPDLEILPGGDATEIGEKGINLSGGQKLRTSLARAVYQDSDIYLLDDPLSAVDAHVGRHIFDNVLGPEGVLRTKVRVLVTHSVTYLSQCDRIVVLDEGRIAEEGTYSELIESNGAFAEFLRTYSNVEESQESEVTPGDDKGGTNASTSDAGNSQKEHPASRDTTASPAKEKNSSLVVEEKTQTGRVHFSVVVAYVKACTCLLSFLTLFFFVCRAGFQVGANFWLAHWSNAEDSSNGTANFGFYIGIYTVFGFSQAVAVVLASAFLVFASMAGAKTLHNKMLANIIRSPMSFFDMTPTGRILNRFSKDTYTIDESIPRSMSTFLGTTITVVSVIVVIAVATPVFISVIVPLAVMYGLIQRFYVAASRQLKRLESVSRSPIYSHFQESITGVSSIRAYCQQARFIHENMSRVDSTNMAYFPSIAINRWLAVRLEFIGALIIFSSALFAAIQRNFSDSLNLGVNAGLIGLSISYALQVTSCLSCVVRETSVLETNIIAVERTKEYSETPTEAPAIIESRRPPQHWPSEGSIQFHHFSTRYREGLDPVLKDLNFTITGKTKVGIVGRTGAGKSSVTLALFRIIEATAGTIFVDSLDISSIGLEDLRSRLTIIPQDPVLFTGTLRLNLDPFDSHADDDLWRVLETAHLSTFVSSLGEGLDYTIAEGGENLSVGQRQLVCLARALLRKSKILVLDEATAAVDLETDDLIQRTIHNEFSDCTVITIAHRINTIMDYDHVLVLSDGRMVEYDTPQGLLSKRGQFYALAKESGLVS